MSRARYLRAAAAIPPGETRSFGEAAALAGRPGAARAAGAAVAACRLDDPAPWHRVVAASGALARDPERAAAQLARLRREGARPRAGESVRRWARRTGRALVASYPRRRFAPADDPRLDAWPPERVEGLADAAAARARRFAPIDEPEPGDGVPDLPAGPPGEPPRGDPAAVAERLAGLDWDEVGDALRERGGVHLPGLLGERDVAAVLAAAREQAFDRSVEMGPRGFGVGRYRYWREPLPEPAEALRSALYGRLRPLADAWRPRGARPFPPTLAGFWRRCRAAGQRRPSSILLAYGPGGVNHPHRDLYGDVWFPLQALVVLSRRGADFEGGDFVLWVDRDDRLEPVFTAPATAGDLVVFATRDRPDGRRRVPLRHGMRAVTGGARFALGVAFHLAR